MGGWEDLARTLPQLVVAFALGIPIGWVRERHHGVGPGVIIKGRAEVHGHAAAVSLWVTVCVGAAAAYGLYLLAAFLSATTLVALRLLRPFKLLGEEAEQDPGEFG